MGLKEKVKFATPGGNNWWKQFTLKRGIPNRIPRGTQSTATIKTTLMRMKQFSSEVTQTHSLISSHADFAPLGKCLRVLSMHCRGLRLKYVTTHDSFKILYKKEYRVFLCTHIVLLYNRTTYNSLAELCFISCSNK